MSLSTTTASFITRPLISSSYSPFLLLFFRIPSLIPSLLILLRTFASQSSYFRPSIPIDRISFLNDCMKSNSPPFLSLFFLRRRRRSPLLSFFLPLLHIIKHQLRDHELHGHGLLLALSPDPDGIDLQSIYFSFFVFCRLIIAWQS